MTDQQQPNRKRLSPGRYPQYGQTMKQTAIWLPLEMLEYLRAQPGTMSDYIRRLIADDMQTTEKKDSTLTPEQEQEFLLQALKMIPWTGDPADDMQKKEG